MWGWHSSYSFPPFWSFIDPVNQARWDYHGLRLQNLINLTIYYTQQFEAKKSNYEWIQNSQIEDKYNK